MMRASKLADLAPEDKQRLQQLRTRFEQATQKGDGADVSRFLPSLQDPMRRFALLQLIECDLENRWRKGHSVLVESYMVQFPELEQDAEYISELLQHEFFVRQEHGDKPALASYQSRFPGHFAELQKRIEETQRTSARSKQTGDDLLPTETISPGGSAAAPAADEHFEATSGGVLPVEGYTLRNCIGRGQFGEVWQALAPGGVEVAIKIIFRPLHHADAKRELDSLEAIKSLRHPFLLRTQAFWSLADRLLIAMELADGNLEDRQKECQKAGLPGIPLQELLRYFHEAAEALDYLHCKNVLHRDVKPDNILIMQRHTKLADFGLARVLENQQMVTSMTMGTPAFMAPEVWQGHYSIFNDQYSLAATYAYLRLQRTLFESGNMARLMMDTLSEKPDLNPLPQAEQAVLLKALAKKPEDRYANCLAFFEALKVAVEPPPQQAPPKLEAGPPINVRQSSSAFSTLAPGFGDTPDVPLEQGSGAAASALPGVAAADANPGPAWQQHVSQSATAPPSRSFEKRAPRTWKGFLTIGVILLVLIGAGTIGLFLSRSPVDFLPKNYQPSSGAGIVQIGTQRLYDRIARALPNGAHVEMVLVAPSRPKDPPAFYIMINKTSNQVFQAFADGHAELLNNSQWQKGGKVVTDTKPRKERDLGVTDSLLPVLRVTVEEAHQCAVWLGGDLPTTRQWLTAAGGHEEGAVGPLAGAATDLNPPDIAINREKEGPMPVGAALKDVRPNGCRDMAGNGREWTRTIATRDKPDDDDAQLPFPLPEGFNPPSIWLLGQMYEASEPMLFADVAEQARYGDALYYVGFRIVIEVPSAP